MCIALPAYRDWPPWPFLAADGSYPQMIIVEQRWTQSEMSIYFLSDHGRDEIATGCSPATHLSRELSILYW